jgi:hypothetical protein
MESINIKSFLIKGVAYTKGAKKSLIIRNFF